KLWEAEKFGFCVDDSNEGKWHSSFDKEPPLGIGISYEPGVAAFIDLENFEGGKSAAIKSIADTFANPHLDKATHDYKCKLAILSKLGIEVVSLKDDLMIASYLLDSGRTHHEIEFLAQNHLDAYPQTVTPDGFSESGFKTTMRADWIFRLPPTMRQRINADGLSRVYSEIEIPLEPILADIENAGMKVDAEALKTFSDFISKELEGLRAKIFKIAGREFNIGSPKQVGEVFEELNIATGRKTATGQVSTSKDVLAELAVDYEIAQLIIDYRELDKLKATYADSLPKMINSDGRIHGVLNQTVAATGRLSSTEPNLQNIPIRTELGQRIRAAFIPEKGNMLISADYSQLELRIPAHITQDPVMLE
ncbi:MAG: DNA polymerase, partial [Pyrinomonadaceae bacterium]|nr:DNA polymerase [Pyrinomonadaceae bacterium]